MEFTILEIVIIIGVILDITSGLPYGERRSWSGVARRTSLGGVFFPRHDDLDSFETRIPSLRNDIIPILEDVEISNTRRSRRRKTRFPGPEILARHQSMNQVRRGVHLPRLEEDVSEAETEYPVFISKKDIPKVLNILDYIVKTDNYRKSRRSKRGRANARQGLIGNSDSMDIIDGELYPQTSSTALSLYEQLSIELSRLRCQELQRQRDALRVLEMADPSNFQHRSDHRDPPC